MIWGHGILLLVGVFCAVVSSLDYWSIFVAAARSVILADGNMVALLPTHACNTIVVMLMAEEQ